MVPFFVLIPLEKTIVSVWNLTWNMTVRSISIRLQVFETTCSATHYNAFQVHIEQQHNDVEIGWEFEWTNRMRDRASERATVAESMFTFYLVLFFISSSELNAPKDMLHKHVSNTPVITNITLNSSFSIPLLLLSLAYCIQYCYSIFLNFSLSLLKSTVERVALHQFTSVRVSMWEFYMLSCQFCPIYQQFNWFFFFLVHCVLSFGALFWSTFCLWHLGIFGSIVCNEWLTS